MIDAIQIARHRILYNAQEAIQHVFDYIDVYYNRQRLHSKLGYLSPVEFEGKIVA